MLTEQCLATGILKNGTADEFGGFDAFGYWSSSERVGFEAGSAWGEQFEFGYQYDSGRATNGSIRIVRAFGNTGGWWKSD